MQITHDWTRTDDISNGYADNPAEAGKRAKLDIDGVCAADVYILMTNNDSPGKGMYVELGAALALAERTKKPEIYVVGPKNHESIFYYHPRARHFEDIDACLEDIQRFRHS